MSLYCKVYRYSSGVENGEDMHKPNVNIYIKGFTEKIQDTIYCDMIKGLKATFVLVFHSQGY